MPEVGSASLAIIPSFKGFQSNLERGVGGSMASAGQSGGKAYASGMATSVKSRARSIFAPLLAAGAAYKAGKFLLSTVTEASNLNESLNAVNVSYGKSAKGVQKLGRQAAKSLGLSNTEFNSLSVRFSSFAQTIAGGDGKKVVGTLDDLTTRASDFASVMNLEVNEAAELFQSGLAGETEPLRRYGLDLSAAAVEAHAFAVGIAKGKGELSESEKVQARYSLLMKQTSKAQGDFKNTSGELANQQRILNARWDNAKAKFGTALLPLMKEGARFLNREGIPAFERFSDWFIKDGIPAIKKFGDFLKDDVAPPLKTAADHAEDLVGFLKDLPKPAKIAGLAALLGGGAYLKMRKGGEGALGSLGRLTGTAKGTPVYVTNWDDAKGGGSGGGKDGIPPIIPAGKGLLKTWGPRLLKGAGMLGAGAGGVRKLDPMMTDAEIERWKKANGQADTFSKTLGAQNNAWAKVRTATDSARESVQLYDGRLQALPKEARTWIKAVNLENVLWGAQQYKSILDGLDGDTVETFIKTTRLKNDTGSSSLQPPNRSGFVGATGGIVTRPTRALIGEAGPEAVVPLNRAPGASALPMGGGTFVLEIDGEQFATRVRQIADDRYTANTRHPTGRRR